MADGKAIAFMEETDIYILFGNMLDNALEAVLKLPEKDKQNITLTVIRQGCYVKVHCENYVNQLPELQDGLPMTSKADKQIHGFGVKSIRLLAEKYAGMISIMPTEDTFSIDLVFPVGQYDADHPKKRRLFDKADEEGDPLLAKESHDGLSFLCDWVDIVPFE